MSARYGGPGPGSHHGIKPGILEVGGGGGEGVPKIQGLPWLDSDFDASLCYMRPCLPETTTKQLKKKAFPMPSLAPTDVDLISVSGCSHRLG